MHHTLQICCSLTLLAALTSIDCLPNDKASSQVPPGYYAFETGSRRHGSPPRVRPPPYLPTDLPCPGANTNSLYTLPKDTLCGDLNRGFIPKNPMSQDIHNQPYPFELIKNKTLHFLAKSLPFLKDDIESIPKVVKLSKAPEPQLSPPSHIHLQSNVHGHHEPLPADLAAYYDYTHVIRKRSPTTQSNASPITTISNAHSPMALNSKAKSGPEARSAEKRSFLQSLATVNNWNLTETREKACEQKDGIMCQLMQSIQGNSLLTTLSQAAQVVSAAHSAASTAQSLGSLASLVTGGGSGDPSKSSSLMSQIVSGLTALNGGTALPGMPTNAAPNTGNSNFSPVLAILDYLASNDKSPVSQLLPARRKKPFDLEEMASETLAAMSANKAPPTPCPSIEEYIAPVFARNYQGVWKYIVQIPHEGYFTQTVQKTSCTKSKCDFMDGACHESPRWVSLLVAEIFYPEARFPNPVPAASNTVLDFSPAKYHHVLPANDFSNFQHLHNPSKSGQQWRSEEEPLESRQTPTAPQLQQINTPMNDQTGRSFGGYRHSRSQFEHDMSKQTNQRESNHIETSETRAKDGNEVREECDGYDKVGCYVIRVYYDWFLVPGSCKCWRKTSPGSLDALKKIFTGKK